MNKEVEEAIIALSQIKKGYNKPVDFALPIIKQAFEDLEELRNSVIKGKRDEVISFVKSISDSITFDDGSVSPEPIWWGMIKWSSACHGGI